MVVDERRDLLCEWINKSTPYGTCELEVASEDASFRRYFRLHTQAGPLVVMDAPPDKEPCASFVHLAGKMREAGIQVPEVHFQDLEQGFLILTDFGDLHYQEALISEQRNHLYDLAIQEISRFQTSLGVWSATLPSFDTQWQSKELEIFREWCLPAISQEEFYTYAKPLIEGVCGIPKSFMHRDFHCRNLLVTADGSPGIIDFQGAMHGPITYDLVSLLRDCYRSNAEDWIDRQVMNFRTQLIQNGLLRPEVGEGTFQKWFDWAGLQRHLKCIGIFHRLNIRDGKPQYLSDVPRVLGYIRKVLKSYPELHDLHAIVEQAEALSSNP